MYGTASYIGDASAGMGDAARGAASLGSHSRAPTPVWPGVHSFLETWAAFGGSLEILATTPEDADDMPGAELKQEEKQGFIDALPTKFEVGR